MHCTDSSYEFVGNILLLLTIEVILFVGCESGGHLKKPFIWDSN